MFSNTVIMLILKYVFYKSWNFQLTEQFLSSFHFQHENYEALFIYGLLWSWICWMYHDFISCPTVTAVTGLLCMQAKFTLQSQNSRPSPPWITNRKLLFSCCSLENITIFRTYCWGVFGVVGVIKVVVETQWADTHLEDVARTYVHRDVAKAHLTLFQEEEKWFLWVALVFWRLI